MSSRAPKQWMLTKDETLNSFTNWKENLLYTLSLDENFTPFLEDGFIWHKKTANNVNRGFVDDPPGSRNRKYGVQKCAKLELMLGQVANYCTIIARNTIVKNSTSLNDIWMKVREHYGFQTTGSRFLDLATIQLRSGERYEDLYQRLMSFFDDNLLTAGSMIHHGEAIFQDEEMSPSLENLIVFLWLQRIHDGLPALVKQRYGAELRNKTLASIKPEISQALESLLEELQSTADARVMRLQIFKPRKSFQHHNSSKFNSDRSSKTCCLCRAANRSGYDTHFLSTCKFLPENDRKFMSRSRIRQVDSFDVETDDEEENPCYQSASNEQIPSDDPFIDTPVNRRVTTRPSPHLQCFYQHYPAMVCIDTGAESNLVSEKFARFTQLQIKPTKQGAAQADGQTPLNTVGETSFPLSYGSHVFNLNALVVRNLGSDIIVGEPFLEYNDIGVRSAKKQIIIKGRDIVPYASTTSTNPTSTRRVTLCRAPPVSTIIFPGEYIEMPVPDVKDSSVALEPRFDSQSKLPNSWPPPQIADVVAGHIHIDNNTSDPILLKRNDHFCQIRNIVEIPIPEISQKIPCEIKHADPPISSLYDTISIDPNNQLSKQWHDKFALLHQKYESVFQDVIGRYNDASGIVRARVNIGNNMPPNRKLKVPNYSNANLQELQEKFDDLERQGVFQRPEDLGIIAEHVSPSFLVRKPSGGTRLVTAFTSIAQYTKILPSSMPSVDDTLRTIANWKYLVISDLKDSFYQIPLDRQSMKWCATPTPYKGLRMYTVSAQGMPGSSETLEEMMCTILGHLIQEGSVGKIADDLYVGGNTIEELFSKWSNVLSILNENGLKLKASKTLVAPTTATILGWIWNNGRIEASPHKISPLATCQLPQTATSMRSFIGSYKVLNRVLRGCAQNLADLENALTGKQKSDKIEWNEQLINSFHKAQSALVDAKTISLPTPEDQLIIVHDGSQLGIGSIMYTLRESQMKLGGFFSAKLKPHQSRWLPCEIEALSISSSIQHFAPYIRQSQHCTQVLTDNKPCVQAWSKMKRGLFSTSARVATFLTTLSDYNIEMQHIAGVYNLPSDFHSRNPASCDSFSCQICSYISESENSAVRAITMNEVLSGQRSMPYTNRNTWKNLQMECCDLRRAHAYLSKGNRPSSKNTKLTITKRYLQKITIAKDGLLIYKDSAPFLPVRELIVVPQQYLRGLLTSLHISFNHPTESQLQKLFSRSYFALKLNDSISFITNACSHCQSLKSVPKELHLQSGSPSPPNPCTTFAADIMRRYKQLIFVLRDTFSSYTVTQLLPDERHNTLRNALIETISYLRPTAQTTVTVRIDNAPGFLALKNDIILKNANIILDFGRIKNKNRNPVAEKCIRELGSELIHLNPDGGPVTTSILAIATSNLNSRIRTRGLSSWEILHQRDQFSGSQLPFMDEQLADAQTSTRERNRKYSSKHKSRGGLPAIEAPISVGSLVYIKDDTDKRKVRDRYLVTSISKDMCELQKFMKDQLRSRRYDVKLTDIYPISSDLSTEVHDKHIPMRGIEDEESDDDDIYFNNDIIPSNSSSKETKDTNDNDHDSFSDNENEYLCRRKRNPPKWFDNYDLY